MSEVSYQLWAELLGLESIEGNPLDPEKDVPHAVLEETTGTLLLLAR